MSKLKKILFILIMSIMSFSSISCKSKTTYLSDRLALLRAIAEEREYISLVLVSKEGRSFELVAQVARFGGVVRTHVDEIGYVRIDVPARNVEKIFNISDLYGAQMVYSLPFFLNSADYSKINSLSTPKKIRHGLTAVELESYSAVGRYIMGDDKLREMAPSFDGRGVTIGLVETFIDPSMAELRSAITLNGHVVRKIPEMYAIYTDLPKSPDNFLPPMGLVEFQTVRTDLNGIVSFDNRRFHFPSSGSFQLGMLDETNTYAENGDLNNDGNPEDVPRTFIVARKGNCIWIDTNQDDDLRDEQCIGLYNESFQTGRFRDSAGQSVGSKFSVIEGFDQNSVIIAAPLEHTQAVALTAVGRDMFGLREVDGVAPGARLIPIAALPRIDSHIEALIFAARHRDIDVIITELTSDHMLQIGDRVFATLLDRISTTYGKLIVIPASNSRRLLNSITDLAAADYVLTVGQYAGQEIKKIFFGDPGHDGFAYFTSGGPNEDGKLAPDLLAPGMSLLPSISYSSYNRQRVNSGFCPNIVLAPGVTCATGTSLAAPAAAGAAAVLISAARQRGLAVTADAVRRALIATARHVPGQPVFIQGRGLIDLPAAWEFLQTMPSNGEAFNLLIEAPVKTVLSGEFQRPHTGKGLYEREGWLPKEKGVRTIYVTRQSGSPIPLKVAVRLIGDDLNTYKVPQYITLPLGKRVPLEVNINVDQAGIYSALIVLENPRTRRYIEDIPLVIVAADELSKHNKYKKEFTVRVENGDGGNILVRVPKNSIALRINHDGGGDYTALPFSPAGHWAGAEDEAMLRGDSDAFDTWDYGTSVYMPAEGVWQITLISLKNNPHSATFTRKLTVEAIVEDDIQDVVAHLADGVNNDEIHRGFYPLSSYRVEEVKYFSENSGSFNIKEKWHPYIVNFNVDPGTKYIDARIFFEDGVDVQRDLLEVSLMFCLDRVCKVKAANIGSGRTGVIYHNPEPGNWVMSVDYSTTYYKSIFFDIFMKTSAGSSANRSSGSFSDYLEKNLNIGRCQGKILEIFNKLFWIVSGKATLDGEFKIYDKFEIPIHRRCL